LGKLAVLLALWASPALANNAAVGPVFTAWPQCLVGSYSGNASELAADLVLEEGGRFVYQLSYGARDEVAQGRWAVRDGAVLLTSDPVTAPTFALVAEQDIAAPELRLTLDLPRGVSPQYFDALIVLADGARTLRSFGHDGLVFAYEPGRRPVSVAILLPVFELQGEAIPVDGQGGREMRIAFETNDLGKVAFADTPLRRDGADLLLDRVGREIRFRPRGAGCAGR